MGRVMTPTMALVVRREEEISKFKPVAHYAVKEIFANNFGEIPATWQVSDKVASLDSEGRLLDKKVAEDFLTRLNVLVVRQGKIIRIEEKNKRENQRLPYLPENQFADSKEMLGHLKDLPNFSELKLGCY